MNSIVQLPYIPKLIYPPNQFSGQAASAGGPSSFSQMEKATLFQSQEADLTIVTKEGDQVTISADSDFSLALTTYDSKGRMKGTQSSLHSETFSLESNQELLISVEGDLNEQEILDIGKVLQSLDKIVTDFQSGQLERMVTRAEKLGTPGSLSSIDATLQVEQGISVESAAMSGTASASDKSTDIPGAIEKPIDFLIPEINQRLEMEPLGDKDLFSASITKKIEKFFLKLSHFLFRNGTHNALGERLLGRFLFSR